MRSDAELTLIAGESMDTATQQSQVFIGGLKSWIVWERYIQVKTKEVSIRWCSVSQREQT
jgi:hypothetical protein